MRYSCYYQNYRQIFATISSILILLFIAQKMNAQDDLLKKYATVYHRNKIQQEQAIEPLLNKLYQLEKGRINKPIKIVWIGDSHTQADLMTSIIRQTLQNKFGHAGRGLVYPFQVAKTSSPKDLISKSNATWVGQRNSRPDLNPICGISGHGMHCSDLYADVEITNVAPSDTFNYIRLFVDTLPLTYGVDYLSYRHEKKYEKENDSSGLTFHLRDYTSTLTVYANNPDRKKVSVYGMSLESFKKPGILFHTIGVNGAQYNNYLRTKLFWQQIKALEADAYIIYLGTNEAQDQHLDNNELYQKIDSMINRLKIISPAASFILCTPPVSFYQKIQPNYILPQVADQIEKASIFQCTALWDLFSISKGISGTYLWKKYNLLNTDLVHFTKEGYALQGNLFVDAFLDTYNRFKENQLQYESKNKTDEDPLKLKTR
ncbi:MAG: SGNH/GDSL hydrolase family protein [Chitinophagaceae bacterium]